MIIDSRYSLTMCIAMLGRAVRFIGGWSRSWAHHFYWPPFACLVYFCPTLWQRIQPSVARQDNYSSCTAYVLLPDKFLTKSTKCLLLALGCYAKVRWILVSNCIWQGLRPNNSTLLSSNWWPAHRDTALFDYYLCLTWRLTDPTMWNQCRSKNATTMKRTSKNHVSFWLRRKSRVVLGLRIAITYQSIWSFRAVPNLERLRVAPWNTLDGEATNVVSSLRWKTFLRKNGHKAEMKTIIKLAMIHQYTTKNPDQAQ